MYNIPAKLPHSASPNRNVQMMTCSSAKESLALQIFKNFTVRLLQHRHIATRQSPLGRVASFLNHTGRTTCKTAKTHEGKVWRASPKTRIVRTITSKTSKTARTVSYHYPVRAITRLSTPLGVGGKTMYTTFRNYSAAVLWSNLRAISLSFMPRTLYHNNLN